MPLPRHVNGANKPGIHGVPTRQSRDFIIGLLGAVMLIQSLALISLLYIRSPDNGARALFPGKSLSGAAGRLAGRIGKLRSSASVVAKVDPNFNLGLDLDLVPGMHDFLSKAAVFEFDKSEGYAVFVTASDGENPAAVAMGMANSADGANAALLAAETELNQLWQLKGFTGRKVKYCKVDVVSSVKNVKSLNPRKDSVDTAGVGVRGLAFDWETGWAFTPDEVMAGSLLDSEHRLHLEKVVEAAADRGNFDSIAFPWGIDEDMRDGDDTIDKFQTFKTESVFIDMQDADDESAAQLVPVFRGHQLFESSDYETLMESAKLAGDYLTEKVDDEGVFLYSYLSKSDSQVDFAQYSITRHAGTVYAMALLFEETGKKDKELIAAAKRALDYLISDKASAMVEAPYSRKKSRCAIDKRHPDKWCCKLGSNGLTVLAIAKYVEAVGDADGKYTEAARQYAEWIVGAQRKDGSFVQKTLFPSGSVDEKKWCPYYPGEAVFGLTQLYKIDKNNEIWLDVAEKGGDFMINKAKDHPENDHWLMYGLRELNAVRPHKYQVTHAMKVTKLNHDNQQGVHVDVKDLAGIYGRHSSLCSTATTTEGMCAAYEIAKANGLEEDAARTLGDIELAAQYQLRAQFRPEGTLHLPNPRRAIGGFKADLDNWEVRIDYVQHSMSGLLCLARAKKTEGREL